MRRLTCKNMYEKVKAVLMTIIYFSSYFSFEFVRCWLTNQKLTNMNLKIIMKSQ